jgi:hypothetical protein
MCPKSNKAYPNSKRAEQSDSKRAGSEMPPDDSPTLKPAHEGGDPPPVGLLQHEEQDFHLMGAWVSAENPPEPQEHADICETISSNAHPPDD